MNKLDINMGMMRRAIAAESAADQAALEDGGSKFTWWHVVLTAALDGETLYREAVNCGLSTAHWVGEHGKPCPRCGAEQIWVLPVEVKE